MSLLRLAGPKGPWSDRASWPLDFPGSPGWVFFGRALDELGRALEPKWRGDEFGLAAPVILPPYRSPLSHNAASQARALLRAHDPAFGLPPLGRMSSEVTQALHAGMKLSTSELLKRGGPSERAAYARALAIAERLARRSRAGLGRAKRAELAIAGACLSGALVTGYRDDRAMQIVQILPSWWNAEPLGSRFASCRIDWTNPSGKVPNGPPQPSWLYVSQPSLAAYVSRHGAPLADWRPLAAGIKVGHWGRPDGPAEAEARRRLIEGGNASPAESHICGELAALWNADHPEKPTTAASLVTQRARARTL